MGILAPFLFLILIFTVGFRYNNWTLSFLILLFGGIFGAILAQGNVEEIKKNWNERRCDLEVMVSAQLYKPATDPRTGGEFASENFSFCTRKIMITVLEMFLAPVYTLLNGQIDVADSINNAFDRFRVMQTELLKGVYKIIEPFFARFKNTGDQFVVNQYKLFTAMGRAFGITQAVLYIGMSLVTTIENFVHLVINVIMIIMYIILGVMILLFPLILPVLGIIIWTCQIIADSPFAYLSEDVCPKVCFDPNTRVRLKGGIIKSIKECVLGDLFEDGTVIEGILVSTGKHEPMFVLDGIRVSGAHLIWYEEHQEWIPVAQHPRASLSLYESPQLICLRTSTRNIPLQGMTQSWVFRDWEELPLNLPTSDTIWDFLVAEILNGDATGTHVPQEDPLLKSNCSVMYKTGEMRPISQIQIGDSLYSSKGFTTVTGLYKGKGNFTSNSDVTDGVWLKSIEATRWEHPSVVGETKPEVGFHLSTESGCFWIQTNQFSGFVRDFTEVGAKNISLTYNYTQQLLKKSFNREESCVSASLSQVLSSCSPLIS
jgi:hypothetical protein